MTRDYSKVYNPANRAGAIKLIRTLVSRGMYLRDISNKLGYEQSWASCVIRKGCIPNNDALKALKQLAGTPPTPKSRIRDVKIHGSGITQDILALFKTGKTTLHSQVIMRKLMAHGHKLGPMQKSLRSLKLSGGLECPHVGYYKLPPAPKMTKHEYIPSHPWDGQNGNEMKKLRKEIRLLKKLTRRIASNQTKLLNQQNS
jgi:hypothetical protein